MEGLLSITDLKDVMGLKRSCKRPLGYGKPVRDLLFINTCLLITGLLSLEDL